jgi:hypothetical protein
MVPRGFFGGRHSGFLRTPEPPLRLKGWHQEPRCGRRDSPRRLAADTLKGAVIKEIRRVLRVPETTAQVLAALARAAAVIGRNGVGKSTLMRTLIGLLPVGAGQIEFAGREVNKSTAQACARMGIGYVPQGLP